MLGPTFDGEPLGRPGRLVGGWWSTTVSGTGTVVPDGAVDLLWVAGSIPWIAGPDTAPRPITLAPGTSAVGVRLRPGVAAALLGDGVDRIVDDQVSLAAAWTGRRLEPILDALGSAPTPGAAARVLVTAVVSAVPDDWRPDELVVAAVAGLRRGRPIDRAGLGDRQFRRRFAATVGYGPAFYRRVARLDRLTDLLDLWPDRTVAELAATAGYFDEAHAWRDCRALTGRSPVALRPPTGRR